VDTPTVADPNDTAMTRSSGTGLTPLKGYAVGRGSPATGSSRPAGNASNCSALTIWSMSEDAPPMNVHGPSISVETNQALSSGHQKFGGSMKAGPSSPGVTFSKDPRQRKYFRPLEVSEALTSSSLWPSSA